MAIEIKSSTSGKTINVSENGRYCCVEIGDSFVNLNSEQAKKLISALKFKSREKYGASFYSAGGTE